MGKALYEIQAIVPEIRKIKEQIKNLDSMPVISTDDWHKRRACQLLNRRIALLLDRLEQIAGGDLEVELRQLQRLRHDLGVSVTRSEANEGSNRN